jgi:hypothetical protein
MAVEALHGSRLVSDRVNGERFYQLTEDAGADEVMVK